MTEMKYNEFDDVSVYRIDGKIYMLRKPLRIETTFDSKSEDHPYDYTTWAQEIGVGGTGMTKLAATCDLLLTARSLFDIYSKDDPDILAQDAKEAFAKLSEYFKEE